ncbi:VUT family protein [Rickettsiella endosymbiont of Dermanyssus gallinae]|uniref:VUT family protein n=1 Tax=Rickettsiella endosymbiont of Dermanyssus gallinae TaxID=2856608 RepID=UPI001C52FBC1|nr:VUT family protein [Rickettsiella endosymbiont of Dermanyssus gallinae]
MINPKKNNNKSNEDIIEFSPRLLWFITLTYSMASLLSNWFIICTISLGGLTLNAGLLIFPIIFLLSNLITEIYGYKHARRAAWCALLFNVFFILYGLCVIYMPYPSYSKNNPLFDIVIITYLKSVFTSVISYFIAESFNLFFIAKLKLGMNGYHIKLRFLLTSSVSLIISGIVFSLIKIYSPLISTELPPIILFAGITLIIGLSVAVYLTEKIKQLEKMDIYDTNTQFNLFSLEVNYTYDDNKFGNNSQ